MEYIALDSHKRYSFASVEEHTGAILREARIDHRRGAIAEFLSAWKPGTSVAVETIGNWYWIVDEIEAAGMAPQLVHARRAKMMLASVNKTDKLDCHGLNRLQRTGTLPTVWIPPAAIRDLRDLPRTRMMLSGERTKLKNRIHATLAKYAINIDGASDAFGKRGLEELERKLELLPSHSRFCVQRLLGILEKLQDEITHFEAQMKKAFRTSTSRLMELLQTLPGVGFILAVVILLEIGEVSRFPDAPRLAAYCAEDRAREPGIVVNLTVCKGERLNSSVSISHRRGQIPPACPCPTRSRPRTACSSRRGLSLSSRLDAGWTKTVLILVDDFKPISPANKRAPARKMWRNDFYSLCEYGYIRDIIAFLNCSELCQLPL
jgi:transposase